MIVFMILKLTTMFVVILVGVDYANFNLMKTYGWC